MSEGMFHGVALAVVVVVVVANLFTMALFKEAQPSTAMERGKYLSFHFHLISFARHLFPFQQIIKITVTMDSIEEFEVGAYQKSQSF